jgi:hypothetical protein
MSLHLRSLRDLPPDLASSSDAVYFVLQRADGHWSPGARIIGVYGSAQVAELAARKQKRTYPQRCFGIAVLTGEAREVADPIEIVKVER